MKKTMISDIYTIIPVKPNREGSKSYFLCYQHPIKAYVYYKTYRYDLINQIKHYYNINQLIEQFDQINIEKHKSKNKKSIKVLHLFYELGFILQNLDSLITDNQILCIELEYAQKKIVPEDQISSPVYLIGDQSFNLSNQTVVNTNQTVVNTNQRIKKQFNLYQKISFQKYNKLFSKGYNHLINGDCYQFNLTYKFHFKWNQFKHLNSLFQSVRIDDTLKLSKFIWSKKEKIGSFAHLTTIGPLHKLYISNSPECLFKIKFQKDSFNLYSMPIKGTQKIQPNDLGDEFNQDIQVKKAWDILKNSKKDQAELFMITDLIRNDLAQIKAKSPLVHILEKKNMLYVPGIVHQFSVIYRNFSASISLGQIIKGLFPGGSITGAPKKRVMSILHNIEKETRGFYTGSTLIMDENVLSCSINIRSAEIDQKMKKISIGAGGGITLLSKAEEEYKEMKNKLKSFLDLFI